MASKSTPVWTIPGLMLGDTNAWDSQVAMTTAKTLVATSLTMKCLLAETKKLQNPSTTAESVLNRAICENNASLVQLTRLVTNLLRSHLFLLADGGVLPIGEEKLNPLDWGGTRCKWPPDPGVAELATEMAEIREERVRSTAVLGAMSDKRSSFSDEVASQAHTFTEERVQEALVGIEQSLENARGATESIEIRIGLSEAKLREDVATDIDAIRNRVSDLSQDFNAHTLEAGQLFSSLGTSPQVSMQDLVNQRDTLRNEAQVMLAELDKRLKPLETGVTGPLHTRRNIVQPGGTGAIPSMDIDRLATALGTKKTMQMSDVVKYNGIGTLTKHRNSLED
jgi:hypothetical protein